MKPAAPSGRLLSLDAFRGATIAAMLLVNNPGSWSDLYPPLEHAPWHGWTPTDMIFPFFLWIVGVAMTLSFARRVEQGADRGELFRHVLVRSAVIIGLGLFLVMFPFGLLPAQLENRDVVLWSAIAGMAAVIVRRVYLSHGVAKARSGTRR